MHRKPLAQLVADSEAGHLRRVIGPGGLVLLGIGAVIGAGIFVYTGTVAAQNAGPGLILSMILAGFVCALAGLCYAELASMIPVAGSAYTYAYATLGELAAWIIGWDLVLEYALSSASVALGWGATAVSVLEELGISVPARFTSPPTNLPAAFVVLVITALLVVGVKESARTNTIIVIIKLGVLAVFIAVGSFFVKPDLWHPLVPPNTGTFGEFGWSGILRGGGIIFFAYIGFDAVSTAAQEARDPQRDMPRGIIGSLLICTVLYVLVSGVMVGLVPYQQLGVPAPMALAVDAARVKAVGSSWQPIVDVLPFIVK
ncbi:MAG TPA: amino acid permease, partial [Gemmatimonadaceae bacterium]|nr:amino acid permease [Gemmatimonadaceae bacterium]